MARSRPPQIGDVFRITLPDDSFRFGRYMNDAGFQVFEQKGSSERFDQGDLRIDFTTALYNDSYKDKRMSHVMNLPFKNKEDSWPPKKYIYDPAFRKYSIYYKGNITPSTREECLGLEDASVWELNSVVQRIMGDTSLVSILS